VGNNVGNACVGNGVGTLGLGLFVPVGAKVLKDCVFVGARVLIDDCVSVGAKVLKDCVFVGAKVLIDDCVFVGAKVLKD